MDFIPVSSPVIGEKEIAYVTDAVRSGWVSSIGPYVERFEQAFAEYVGVRHAVAVSNGTVGLHLALHALGVGKGDEVIVPALTFAATVHTVLQTGAKPVFVDVEQDTWCIDPRAVQRAVTRRTKAIIPVHLYGHPADMAALSQIAAASGIHLIEDAAEAHGAVLDGRRVGSLSEAGVFSFYGNKIITTGEGGMITTDDDDLARRLRFLKDHGMSAERRYYHTELAFNYRLTNLQAALGLAQLEQIDAFLACKRKIATWYRSYLEAAPELQLPVERPGAHNVYWMFSVVLDPAGRTSRTELARRLHAAGIDSRPFFVPLPELPHLSRYRQVSASGRGCPESSRLGSAGLNLPSGTGLKFEQVRRVCEGLLQALN